MTEPKYPLVAASEYAGIWYERKHYPMMPHPTHQVVPVGAVVIERDEYGQIPFERKQAAARQLTSFLSLGDALRVVSWIVDALAVGERETPE